MLQRKNEFSKWAKIREERGSDVEAVRPPQKTKKKKKTKKKGEPNKRRDSPPRETKYNSIST
jgi:hypothetical protein